MCFSFKNKDISKVTPNFCMVVYIYCMCVKHILNHFRVPSTIGREDISCLYYKVLLRGSMLEIFKVYVV